VGDRGGVGESRVGVGAVGAQREGVTGRTGA